MVFAFLPMLKGIAIILTPFEWLPQRSEGGAAKRRLHRMHRQRRFAANNRPEHTSGVWVRFNASVDVTCASSGGKAARPDTMSYAIHPNRVELNLCADGSLRKQVLWADIERNAKCHGHVFVVWPSFFSLVHQGCG